MSTEGRDLLRLMTWLSPAFPVGAFSYSHGLEWAVHAGAVSDADSLHDWLCDLVERGSGWNDAVLLAEAWRAARDHDELARVSELASALASSLERHRETMQQGQAFLSAAAPWLAAGTAGAMPYPIAIGMTAARLGTGLEATLIAFLHAFTGNLVSAAIRLGPIGQKEGAKVLARLEPTILATAARASRSSLDDLGSATFTSEMAAMRHETLEPRLFRS